jgi:hypothetical protein
VLGVAVGRGRRSVGVLWPGMYDHPVVLEWWTVRFLRRGIAGWEEVRGFSGFYLFLGFKVFEPHVRVMIFEELFGSYSYYMDGHFSMVSCCLMATIR